MVVYVASGHVLHFDMAHGRARSHGRHRRVTPGSVATIFSVGRLRQGDVQDPKIGETDSRKRANYDDTYDMIWCNYEIVA